MTFIFIIVGERRRVASSARDGADSADSGARGARGIGRATRVVHVRSVRELLHVSLSPSPLASCAPRRFLSRRNRHLISFSRLKSRNNSRSSSRQQTKRLVFAPMIASHCASERDAASAHLRAHGAREGGARVSRRYAGEEKKGAAEIFFRETRWRRGTSRGEHREASESAGGLDSAVRSE